MIKDTKRRAKKIIELLKAEYPDSGCSLKFKTAHQLLVSTILSAQTTDEQVNKITPGLFKKYKSIHDFAAADMTQLENNIKSIGLYRNKAKSIKNSAVAILHDFGGKVPDKLGDIIKLPGVGRKTGSVILGTWYKKIEGIVVDTHVKRIANLLGLTDNKDPYKIELDLMRLIAKKDWIILTHLLIDHGRAVCIARRPRCDTCILNPQCPSARL
ncbi:MAG: endonuclease III [Candidatus Zixiibacteriota bacterium]